MKASQDLLNVWRRFDNHPMETLTKAWYYSRASEPRQRSVALMREHRHQYGTSGNCFDLALWLIDEYEKEGLVSYAIGHDLHTPNAHVAVVVMNDRGHLFFCDLGDQWIDPILIDPRNSNYCEEELEHFTTAGKLKVEASAHEVHFTYVRPNGKASRQRFDLRAIEPAELMAAANFSQSLLRHPLVEVRVYSDAEVLHWEFDRWNSFINCNQGRVEEEKLETVDEWAERIHSRSGIGKEIIVEALEVYSRKLK